MKTNKAITYAALNAHYLNTQTGRINADYLNDAIIIVGDNTQRYYKDVTKSRRAIRAIVWEIFADLATDHIRTVEYPYNQSHYASGAQLKAWLDEYGDSYETLTPAIDFFKRQREEYKEN